MMLTLPLLDHALELVVEHQELDANAVLGSGGHLHGGHAEGCIAVNVDDVFVRCSHLGADARGQTVTHSAETARRHPGSRVRPSEVLACPHLMLADTSGDDDVLLLASAPVVEGLDDLLGLHEFALGRVTGLEGEGELLLPLGNLLVPRLTGLG